MKIFVKDLKDGDFITDEVFSVEEIQMHKTRAQNPYYRLVLQDRTGEVSAKIWQDDFPNCRIKNLESGDVVKIDAQIQSYNEQLQMIIKKLDKTEDYDISDLVQSTDKDLEKMYSELLAVIDEVKNKDLKNLLKDIFGDAVLVKKYKRAPAAEKVHHDFVGGLLEHTLEMLHMAEPLLTSYPEADKDLVTAGIILHDIGKLEELALKKTAIIRTIKGRLIGHLVLGIDLVRNHLPKEFPENLWMKLEHIIISHQGELENGSPIKPATIEAAIVHFTDHASSQIRQFQKAIKLGEGRDPGFSEWQKWIGTQVYLD
ncbi:MAG: HD domain-containing protein [Candidatus Dojkabacteria bacterium]|nr:HD domain-containing protein [Candidatus Dojkabacteria bacterium]